MTKRASGPNSQWALIADRDKDKAIRGYNLLRVRAADATTLHLTPPYGNNAQFEDLANAVSIEIRDLDGDGNDDALLVADWERHAQITDPCQGCYRTQDEEASQLYVVSGDGVEPKVAFTHLVKIARTARATRRATPSPSRIPTTWRTTGGSPARRRSSS